MRILALIPGGIDNQIYFFPTLETLKIKYPNSKIDVLVEPSSAKAYRVCKYVNDVLLFDYQDRNSMAEYLNTLGVIRDREYEIALSFGTPWTVRSLLWLNGIPKVVSNKNGSGGLFSATIPLNQDLYRPLVYHEFLKELEIEKECPILKINVPQEDINWVESKNKSLGISDSGYILLENQQETYPTKYWKDIVKDIQQKQPDLPIVLLQNTGNQEWIKAMMEFDSKLKITAPSDIGKLAATIAASNIIVTSLIASISLAVATGTYTIGLLGSSEKAQQLLPPQNESSIAIISDTGKISDISSQKVLAKMWS